MWLLVPAPLHRAVLRSAHRVRRTWWQLRKPVVTGCRVIALDDDGRILMIRQSYGKRQWVLPAGGMRRGEDPLATAARELAEETACGLSDARYIELSVEPLHGARNEVHIVAGRVTGEARADRREVIEVRFFAIDALPDDVHPRLPEMLPRWLALHSGPGVSR